MAQPTEQQPVMMESSTSNHHRLPADQGYALWRRPSWWVWFGVGMLLSLYLAVGIPMLCIVHCLIHPSTLHAEHQHHQQPSALSTSLLCTAHGSPAQGSTPHPVPPAIYPAVLIALVIIVIRPRVLAYPLRAVAAPTQWDRDLLLPPPRLAR
jgi:hypothetical protein